MILGKGQFSWLAALAELLIIALGVLVALGADAWNDRRLARGEEADYLSRVFSELQVDTAAHTFILTRVELKEASLRRIAAVLGSSDASLPDTASFLTDLGDASDLGWNAGPLAESATFEDLRSSGKLGLIRDPALRMSIINYYRRAEGEDRRIIARRTQYPHIAYRIVPQSGELLEGQFGGVELVAAENRASVVAAVRASELSDHVIAETNRALFIHGAVTSLRGQALTLLGVISDYLDATR